MHTTPAAGVRGYPTLKFFPAGTGKTAASAKEYNGPRDADGLASTLRNMVEASGGGAAPVVQLTSAGQWTDECATGKRVCILTVLPHILDDGAAKRNARLAVLEEVAKKVRVVLAS